MEKSSAATPVRHSAQSTWRTLLVYGILALIIYFGHEYLQTALGERALQQVPLEKLTLEEALSASRASGKPVLLDLAAIWCPSCRKLDQKVLSDPAVVEAIRNKYVFTRVEFESATGETVQQKYQVKGFPTLLVVDGNGDLIRQLPLSFDPREFIRSL